MEGKSKPQQRNLTQKQFEVLRLLYRFRFGTSDLISLAQGGVTRHTAHMRLKALIEKGLIVRKHDGQDKLQGKPAVYRLATKGSNILASEGDKYSPRVLNSIRANRTISDRFINHHLAIFAIFNKLNAKYGEDIVFLTKSNLDNEDFDYLPAVRPDVFAHLTTDGSYYFMYLLEESTPDFALVRRVSTLFEFEKSGIWEGRTGKVLPTILLACDSKRLETVMQKRFAKLKFDNESELNFATTVVSRLLENDNDTVWKRVGDADELLPLNGI
jgi:DNA-binding MarR family transcriptional regulator